MNSVEPVSYVPADPHYVGELYKTFGQRKPMGQAAKSPDLPHFFLLRPFMGYTDMLTILNTKRCPYSCTHCALPLKSTREFVPDEAVHAQFRYVTDELRHALSLVTSVTLSNEGSVLDESTLGRAALDAIVGDIADMKRVRRLRLETRLEFVEAKRLIQLRQRLGKLASQAEIGALIGYESHDPAIRKFLGKPETPDKTRNGLDQVAAGGASLAAYILYKPLPSMSDAAAMQEAQDSVGFLAEECAQREMGLEIRLNPTYVAQGTRLQKLVESSPDSYRPPNLVDVMRVAQWCRTDMELKNVYIGLSDEGLGAGSYQDHSDYDEGLVGYCKRFNEDSTQTVFDWAKIADRGIRIN